MSQSNAAFTTALKQRDKIMLRKKRGQNVARGVEAMPLRRLIARWKEWSVTDCDITYEERLSCARELERLLK